MSRPVRPREWEGDGRADETLDPMRARSQEAPPTAGSPDPRRVTAADRYQLLLAVSEAIVSNRDLPALFHELAGYLHPVVRFDYLALILHDPALDVLRLHVLEPPDPALLSSAEAVPP